MWPGKTRKGIVLAAAIGVLVGIGLLTVFLAVGSASSSKRELVRAASATPAPQEPSAASAATDSPSPTPTPTTYSHFGLLDGVEMTEEEWDARKDLLPLAVMFDNSDQAFPHAGLGSADVIYEAFVEGGITRLMAVYWRRNADYLEPIRSARTPFVVWAAELGALFAHAGGPNTDNDADAIGQIARWGVRDLNAFGPIADEYYRDPDREGPHDLATSTAALREGGVRMGFAGPPTVESWLFRDSSTAPLAGVAAEGIEIDFGERRSQWQLMQYRWDQSTRTYSRHQYGVQHLDARTREPLRFTTVIALRAPFVVVDDEGHVVVDQIGAGKATVFSDGLAVDAIWKKPGRDARTRFFDANGVEIQFARGPIFIEVIGPASSVLVKARADDLPDLPPYVAPPPFVPTPEPEETITTTPTPGPTSAATQSVTPPVPTKTLPTGTAVPPPPTTATPPSTPVPPPTGTVAQP